MYPEFSLGKKTVSRDGKSLSKCVFVAEMKEFLKDNPTNSLNENFLRRCCEALYLSSTMTTLRNVRDYCLAYKKELGLEHIQRSDFKSRVCRFVSFGQVKEVPAKELAMHVARKLGSDRVLTNDILKELCGELRLPQKQFKKLRIAYTTHKKETLLDNFQESPQTSKPYSPVTEKVIDGKCYHGNESQTNHDFKKSDKLDDEGTSQNIPEESNDTSFESDINSIAEVSRESELPVNEPFFIKDISKGPHLFEMDKSVWHVMKKIQVNRLQSSKP